ncbi:hypothetical protein AKJ09_07263 [Labilithrix luteola]|uniref:Uncharacterized protein n=1 Tax=Labilithrix luteola TaxID=1391654 RepID=A0A0K1Q5C0_9BACT|nr:hypothetical protein [Labilithrix luteola]AKV00600.1 hypothetical protein AKJ09_07263 [Labilithrix luteola]
MSTREAWSSTPLPAVIVPDVIGASLAASVRRSLEELGYERYALVDRGSYDHVSSPPLAELLEALRGVASEITGRSLAVSEARALRLLPGDYVLVRHDRVYDDRPVELVLDLSAEVVPRAEVHYRHRGQVFFTAPSSPGSMSLVERGPTVMSNHTYVSKRFASASVVRLMALLRGA